MDAVSDPAVESVVLKCSAQVGKTEIINNTVGFFVDQDPSPILVILPTLELGESWSKDRLAPMLRDTPCLKGKVKDPRARDSGNTLRHKVFPGGHLTIAGANSPASLSSRPVRIVLCDEVDRYPASAGTEGDPVDLSRKRSTTFWNKKSILCSTPTNEGASRIDTAFEASDQRFFFVPCPDCGGTQTLKWPNVHWDEGHPESAHYVCEHCGVLWNDAKRWRAIKQGHWKATQPANGVAGFHLNELYSSWVKLRETAAAFLKAKDFPELLKVWVNTSLGESWQQRGEAPEWKLLHERAEHYEIGKVPRGALFLTAGADIQKDRIEVQIIGWGRAKQNWSVDYIVLDGDPYRPEVWAKLSELITLQLPSVYGPRMSISSIAVDSGYAAQEVYAWARKQAPGRILVVKGNDQRLGAPVGQPQAVDVNHRGKKIARGIKVWPVAVHIFKSDLYGWLRLEKPSEEKGDPFPPGYCHFPRYQEEFFQQLCAEELVARIHKGYKKLEWQKTRERNEALDTWVYARAAAAVVGLDRFMERHWQKLEADLDLAPVVIQAAQTQPPQPTLPQPPKALTQRPPQPSGWLGSRGRGWMKRF